MARNASRIVAVLMLAAMSATALAAGKGMRGVVTAPDGSAVRGDNWALLIGINRYAEWKSLQYPVKDVKAFKQVLLERYAFEPGCVVELYDAQATKAGINAAMEGLLDKLGRNDSLLIYYSGHGYKNPRTGVGYWIPHDAGLDRYARDHWINNADVRGVIGSTKCRHVLLISDSCFSGDILDTKKGRGRDTGSRYYLNAWKRESRQALTAGASEEVPDRSWFAYHLRRFLEANRQPYVDPEDIHAYVKRGVRDQVPLLGFFRDAGHVQGGSYLFFLKPPKGPGPVVAPRVGALQLSCNVDGAQVWLDGELAGTVQGGAFAKANVAIGQRAISIKMEGYTDWSERVAVEEGRTAALRAVLEKLPEMAKLSVRSEPSGAEIFFSTMDKSYGRTPKTFTAQPGAYDIILRFANGQTWRGQATIDGPGDRKEVVGRPPEKPVVVAPRPKPVARPKPAEPRPGDVRTNPTDGAEMVWIPAGQFLMGADRADNERIFDKFGWKKEWIDKYAKDEAPKHRVQLDGFWMYKYEVTARQFGKFVEATGYRTDAEREGKGRHYNAGENTFEWVDGLSWRFPFKKGERARPDHPVVQVSWNDAQAYCRWAGVRLPTEAEWEYGARGGNTGLGGKPHHAFVWGNDAPSKAVANFWDESAARKWGDKYLKFPNYDDGYALTAPVGAYAANELGLFDMAGNVWEWCQDWYDEGYYARSETNNPTGATTGTYRVLRGGAWIFTPGFLRVSNRCRNAPVYRNADIGFRCARTP